MQCRLFKVWCDFLQDHLGEPFEHMTKAGHMLWSGHRAHTSHLVLCCRRRLRNTAKWLNVSDLGMRLESAHMSSSHESTDPCCVSLGMRLATLTTHTPSLCWEWDKQLLHSHKQFPWVDLWVWEWDSAPMGPSTPTWTNNPIKQFLWVLGGSLVLRLENSVEQFLRSHVCQAYPSNASWCRSCSTPRTVNPLRREHLGNVYKLCCLEFGKEMSHNAPANCHHTPFPSILLKRQKLPQSDGILRMWSVQQHGCVVILKTCSRSNLLW